MTKVWNGHTSKAGVYLQFGHYLQRHIGATFDGQFAFDTNTSNPEDTGYAYANAAIGTYNNYTEGTAVSDYAPNWTVAEWYLQDSWKAFPKLTLEYGVRFTYDIPTQLKPGNGAGFVPSKYNPAKAPLLYLPYTDVRNPKKPVRSAIIDPAVAGVPGSAGNPIQPAVFIGQFVPGSGDFFNGTVVNTDPGYPSSLRNSKGLLMAPRLGFAYDPYGLGKTVFRGGAGLFYNTREGGGTVGDYSLIGPIVINPQQNYGDVSQFANNCSGTACSSGFNLVNPQSTRILQLNRPIETSFSTSLGIQQSIGYQTSIDIAYVGTYGRHLSEQVDLNKVPYLSQYDRKNADPSQPTLTPIQGKDAAYCSANPADYLHCQQIALSDNFFRPTPGYASINLRQYEGSSSYHSLQAQITRRFAKGLQFGVVYTWSKAMTDADTVNGGVATYQPRRWWDYAEATFDRTNNLQTHWMWDLPKGSSLWNNAVTRTVLNNWQYSGIAEFVSGVPQPITFSVSTLNLTGGGDGARVVATGNPILPKGKRTVDQYFDTSVIALPPYGQIPTENTPGITRSIVFRGPGIENFDMAMNKNFPIRERYLFQFRVESYNTFNHTSFSAVDTKATFNSSGVNTSTTFGNLTKDRAPRTLQLSARINF